MMSRLMHTKHAVSIGIILLLVFIFAVSYQVQGFIEGSFFQIKSFFENHEIIGVFLFFSLSAFSAIISPFSVVPFIPIGVLVWGNEMSLLLVLGGWVCGGMISFGLARFLGRPFLKKFISFEQVDRYVTVLPQRLEFEVLLLFRLAVPAEIPGYAVGLTQYPFLPYMAATFLAELPFAIISVYASQSLLEKNFLVVIAWVAAAAAIIGFSFRLFRRVVQQNRV